ncbi:sugar porter family MFS transporter [Segnochrobactrum spirostomi]|uniref:Sugar porter family MFS transporter n=1 Tax=Segnochrobactrum spirostomi TaxID=2608987 RepID=A0A6A7Y6U5_9HYPH|nr:sugar porter family MFS transporter [Segnochrobactrum spirostomi]MQT14425.1 sugar porter family MFS transporter [Segnochrobactrum spirostomi]
MIYLIVAVVAIAGFLFGFDEGVIAGALHLLKSQFDIGPLAEGIMTSAVPFGAFFGALVGGRLAEPIGRRKLLVFAALLFTVGAALAAAAVSVQFLTAARLVLGIAIGIAGMVAPLYISESAPAQKRGMFVSVYQLAITLGILGAYMVGYLVSDSWRLMFGLGMVPALALLVGILILSDTPRWLALNNRRDEARATIARIHGVAPNAAVVTEELAEIARTADQASRGSGLSALLTPMVRPALIVGMGLFLLQQLSGINAVIYYAPQVFQLSGFGSVETQVLATVGVGVVNVAMTVVGMGLIDRIGRRRLLMIGFAGTAISLGMIAVASTIDSPALHYVALVGLALYIASFAVSLGPLPFVVMSEIFPLHVRGLGMSIASLSNWGFNFLIVLSFPVLVAAIGLAGVFTIYALICVIGFIFAVRMVPETKGLTLEAIEDHLRSGRSLRSLGRGSLAAAR